MGNLKHWQYRRIGRYICRSRRQKNRVDRRLGSDNDNVLILFHISSHGILTCPCQYANDLITHVQGDNLKTLMLHISEAMI